MSILFFSGGGGDVNRKGKNKGFLSVLMAAGQLLKESPHTSQGPLVWAPCLRAIHGEERQPTNHVVKTSLYLFISEEPSKPRGCCQEQGCLYCEELN